MGMMRKQNASLPQVERLRGRLTSQIILGVMLGFLVIGLFVVLLTGVFNRQGAEQAQNEVLQHIAEDSQAWWDDARGETLYLANADNTRSFASYAAQGTPESTQFEGLRTALAQTFVASLERAGGTILAVRYVSSNGFVLVEVTNYPDEDIQIASEPRLLGSMDQRLFQLGLNAQPGAAVNSDLTFRMYPNRDQIFDPLTPLLRIAAPVMPTGDMMSLAGQIQIDISPEPMFAALRQTAQDAVVGDSMPRRIILLDGAGNLLLDSNNLTANYLRRYANGFGVPLVSQIPEAAQIANNPDAAIDNFPVGDQLYALRDLPIQGTGSPAWQVLLVDDLTAAPNTAVLFALAALGLVLAVGVGVSYWANRVVRRGLRPLEATAAAARQITGDDAVGQALPGTSGIVEITQAFDHLRGQMGALNETIDVRTRRYGRNLEIASRISQETGKLNDIDTLFQRTIDLICDEFGFYHAQIFLIDDIAEYALLRFSHGEAGAALLARNHKLGVGSRSVIGQVTQLGQPVIINDTVLQGDVHRPNPLLPNTRAEMALPMRIDQRVVGALDIQSEQPEVFHDQEVQIFQLLADQLAVALQNARLAAEADARVRQVDDLNRQFIQQAWREAMNHDEIEQSYRYNLVAVEPGAPRGAGQRIPIMVRGVVVGELETTTADNLPLTEGDMAFLRAIADRVGLAIENARLLGEIQSSLSETFVLYQLSRTLGEAQSLSDVIAAIISTMMPDAVAGCIALFDFEATTGMPLTISADWHVSKTLDLQGEQLDADDHAFMRSISSEQVTLIEDIDLDRRLDAPLRSILGHGMGLRAGVIVPFSVRGRWRGVMIVGYDHARTFSEREGRLLNALIDQAGVTIDNRVLLNENEMALTQIERLYSGSRVVNMAQSALDVVRAAVATNNDLAIGFDLALLEGDLDATGYPSQMRIVARSLGSDVIGADEVYPVLLSAESPLRSREHLTLSLDSREVGTSDFARYMRHHRYRFGMVFPLYSANQPIALFFVVSEEPRSVVADDLEIYRALTGQMSTVLQNRRLLEQTAQALDETRRLYDASRAIAAADTEDAIYAAAIDPLIHTSPLLSRASIWLTKGNESYDAPFVTNAYDWSKVTQTNTPALRISTDIIPFGRLFNAYRAALRYNRPKDELPPLGLTGLLSWLDKNDSGSVLIVPLQTRQRWLGVLILESDKIDSFSAQAVPFTQAVADQLAVAIDSLQSFNEAQAQARRAIALAEAGQVANRVGADLGSSLHEVFSRIADAGDFNTWQLLLRDESGEWLEEVTAYMPRAEITRSTRYGVHTVQHSIMDAFHSRKAVIVNDPSGYAAFANLSPDARAELGKHVAAPVRVQNEVLGVLFFGRYLYSDDINEDDEQLVVTLASQIAVALENRRLLRSAELERETLQNILNTLPVGVMVLDGRSLRPSSHNEQAQALMGRPIDPNAMFTVEAYNLRRTGTDVLYPVSELPIYAALKNGKGAFSDDVSIIQPDGTEIDLLLNAAPLFDERGNIHSVIVAFQNISTLRNLEDTLQDNLREMITLYETTRALSEAAQVEDVLDLIMFQLSLQNSDEVYLLMTEENGLRLARSLNTQTDTVSLPDRLFAAIQSQFIGNVSSSKLMAAEDKAALQAQGIAALVVLPMRSRARDNSVLGWAVLTFSTPQMFSLEREQAFTTLVESAAVTLDNRYLIISTEAALAETASLYSATTALSRAGSQDDLMQALDAALMWLKPDCHAAYALRDGTMSEVFSVSMDNGPIDFTNILVALGDLQDIYAVPDVDLLAADDPIRALIKALGNIRSLMVTPLRGQNTLMGSLVTAYHTPQSQNENVSRYLRSLADSASVVTDNLFLLDQIQSNLTETSMLYLASRDLSDAVSERDILTAFVEHLLDSSITRAMVLMLNERGWQEAGAVLTVTASWQPEDSAIPDLTGITLEREDFPAWSVFDVTDVVAIENVMTDARLDEPARISLINLGIAAFSVLPLRSSDRALGILLLSSDLPYVYEEANLRVYRSFARQASLRLEASRLLAQTQRRERQLVTSARVSQLASTLEELPRLLPTIVEMIKDAFSYDHAQIFLMDDDDRFAVLRASTGEAGEKLLARNHKLEKGSPSVIGRVTASGEPVIALDTASSKVPHRPNPLLPKTRSEMAVPLILKGAVIGALDVQSNQSNFFNDDDVTVLTTLAAQISVAIDNAQLYDQSQSRAKDMYFLFTVASAASGAETVEDAATNIVNSLQELLNAASVSIYLPILLSDGETTITELRPAAVSGTLMPLSEISQVRLDDPTNLLAESALDRRPMVVNHLSQEPRYLPVVSNAGAAMLVPLTLGNELVALIVIEDERDDAFEDDALTLILTLSGSLAAAVQNQQLLEDLQRSNEQLVELDRLKSDFLANMSHELRTPLNSIIGFSRVILKGIDGPLTEMQEQDLSTIYNSGQHLLNLINDILDQAKIAAGKMDMQIDYFDLKPVIDGVRSIGIGLVKDKPIEITVHLEPGLPKAYGDEFRMRQVLLNLVSNAAKFTDEGSITINAYRTGDLHSGVDMLAIDVVDTGMGIANKDLPLLFEAFRQVDSSLTKTHGGTGLGLPIAKSLMEMQGGTILVESTVNVGSTFSIRIPSAPIPVEPEASDLQEGAEPDKHPTGETGRLDPNALPPHVLAAMGGDTAAPAPEATPERVAQNGGSASQDTARQFIPVRRRAPVHIKRQILLVEDNLDLVDQLRRTLQREGFEVFTVSTAMEAEAMASGLRPTLIVLDADFASHSGWALLERFQGRDDTVDTPIIVLSLAEETQRAHNLGAFRFIRKPFMPETLADATREAEQAARIERILIIDDDDKSARLLKDLLGETGSFRIYHAANGVEGVSMVARRRPDLVICDLRMPEMDGFKVIQELRSNPETADIPIMVVTGDTLNQHEISQLSEMKVIYKPDIDMEGQRVFLDNVKDQLSKHNGDN